MMQCLCVFKGSLGAVSETVAISASAMQKPTANPT